MEFGEFQLPPSSVSAASMHDSLSAGKSRLSKRAEALLLDHLGIMAPIVVEEVLSVVAAAEPQNEQQMLAEFFANLRKALPSELDSDTVIDSLYASYWRL
jgi:hypothetical protein